MDACCSHGDDAYGRANTSVVGRLYWIFFGTAFVLNAYLADFVYPQNPLVADVSAAIGALILALPIFRSAIRDVWRGELHMDALVALAVLAAMTQGDFRTAGVVAFFMLISLVIESRTAQGAHAAIENLIRLTPSTARRLGKDGREDEIPSAQLSVGDRIRVRPGENIPADGTIASGTTTLNEASITGESLPRDKGPGDEVFAGTQNLTGMVEIEVTRVGPDTTLGRVRDLILAAEKTRLPISRIIDRYMAYYTPAVLMIAALVWFFTDDWQRVIALLVISCPCALILATPTAMVAALSSAARLGILVKNVGDLESASRITAMIFDKTGTLTSGELGVVRLAPCEGIAPSALLHAAASAERYSKHPAAKALFALAEKTGLRLSEPQDFKEEAGQGVAASVDGEPVLSGRATWLRARHVKGVPENVASDAEGLSAVFVARGGRYMGWIGMRDQVRPEAKDAIAELHALGIRRVAMVTGDRETVARQVAELIGCREVVAECLPAQKVDFVNRVKRDGYRVAFVGDGVNDAPALTSGDTGIAMGAAGHDVAIHSATVALMNNDLRRVPFLVGLSRGARAVVYQNLGVGGLFIVGGLALSGLGLLSPIVAAVMHHAGSLIVIFNSARLVRAGEELEGNAQLDAAVPVAAETGAVS
jgi:Cd2+/Zn2+-exporting ATPase